MSPSDEESDECDPPSAQRVASRALALTATAYRAIVEQSVAAEVAEQRRAELQIWLRDVGLAAELERHEQQLVDTPVGRVGRQQLVDASWRSEGMLVLAWALRRVEMPAADAQVDPAEIAQSLGFLGPVENTILFSPKLRPAVEIESYGSRARSIHWRLREFSLRRCAIDFRKTAETSWFPLTTDGIALAEGDLAIGGLPLSRAQDSSWHVAMSIARERHQAVNWLLGDGALYSEVDTST